MQDVQLIPSGLANNMAHSKACCQPGNCAKYIVLNYRIVISYSKPMRTSNITTSKEL